MLNGDREEPFARARAAMVDAQLRKRGIHEARVLAAMSKVPRHEFVGPEHWPDAYADHPVPIGEQQTTSQPYMIASMLQAAEIAPHDRVLEVGAGSGYQTALLAELAAQVFAVERHPALVEGARKTLERLGYKNAMIVEGDGSLGLPQHAPYDAIIVAAAAPRVPPALTEQLAPEGRLVIPVGDAHQQSLQVGYKRSDGVVTLRVLEGCRFVPLIGKQGFWE